MTAPFTSLPYDARPDLAAGMRREWARLSRPGNWWSGAERVAIAVATRRSQAGANHHSDVLPAVAVEAAIRLALAPAETTRDMVAAQPAAGLAHAPYVEIAGVVSRIAAVDAVHRALGADLEPFPTPIDGPPEKIPAPSRGLSDKAFVPMVGGASIVGALSLVPAEMEAQRDIHGPLYLSYEQMGLANFQRGLHRSQMELVAATTSALNECFY